MDKKIDGPKRKDVSKKGEPAPGQGVRGLDTWKKLAAARAAAKDDQGRAQLASDPAAYFRQFGLEEFAPGDNAQLSELESELLSAKAFDEVEVTARRGVVAAVVTPGAAVNTVEAGNCAGNVNVGGNLNVGKNAQWLWGFGCI